MREREREERVEREREREERVEREKKELRERRKS